MYESFVSRGLVIYAGGEDVVLSGVRTFWDYVQLLTM